ncbi:peptidoglycan-binding protein [Actinomadura hibisca]|uniref:peptidoglycan-binding protein n=1 Tax=Actinomadura hibisca TaxID=68565 RepID=UPI000832C094|nr:peptidoglycan-binding domain-containing protein [Actinomadura hibisca]
MRRWRAALLGAAGIAAVAGAGLATAGLGGGGGAPPARGAVPPATASVEKTTLVETQKVGGTLGYGDTRTAASAGSGTLTWLARPGARIVRGGTAFKIDNRPVPLLYGSLPLYRTLRSGVEGADVRQVERNLRALGYTGFTVDKVYSAATAAAVKRWQDDLGMAETGEIRAGTVLVVPGEIRVAARKAAVGDRAGGPAFTYTGTARVVSVDLDVQYQRLARTGAEVTVELPEGGTVKGRVSEVGKVATAGRADEPTTVKVLVKVGRQGALGSYDKAPVEVHLTARRHPDVLAVPVGALLAQADGGYAVQLASGALVPVETGVFAEGKVEVSGTGLAEGVKVGIPK